MNLRELSIDGCFSEHIFLFSVADVLAELCRKHLTFHTWVRVTHFDDDDDSNNNHNNDNKIIIIIIINDYVNYLVW